MHISEGVLSPAVLAIGAAVTVIGTGIGLWRLDYDRVPQVAVLSSVLFLASLIHVPIGPASIHLILNGLTGLMLGFAAFPAILIALTLQAVMFQFGGLTTLGVNTAVMALPAVVCYFLYSRFARGKRNSIALLAAFACGFSAVLLGAILLGLALIGTDSRGFLAPAATALAVHVPVMLIEGFITLFVVSFLRKVRPEILEVPHVRSSKS